MERPPLEAKRPRRRGLAWRVALAAVAALAIAAGWDRGPDVLVDYGRELYVPWRLVEGERLHEDIAWFNGPLGPWTIAAWMRVFGVSVDALQALDALVLVATLALLAAFARRIAGELAAAVGGACFVGVFGVSQQVAIGNFQFLAPYSHGITFGFACALASTWTLSRAVEDDAAWPPLVAGVWLGLAFLTKAEVFLAAAAAAVVGLAATLGSGRTRGRRARIASLFALGAALAPAAALVRFAVELGPARAPRALAGSWVHVLDASVRDLPYYRVMRGTDDLGASLGRIARHSAGTAALLAAVYGAAAAVVRAGARPALARVAAFALGGLALAAALLAVETRWLLVPLPAALALMAVPAARAWLRERDGARARDAVLLVALLALGLALLPKVALAATSRQYGFVLCVPGTLLAVCALVRWLPDRLAGERPELRAALRAAGAGVVVAFTAAHAHTTWTRLAAKEHVFGEGPDRLLVEGWRGTVLDAALREVDARIGPGGTLLVVPEGVLLDYRTRRRTPTSVVNLMPPELAFFGEERVVAELAAEPPDAVILVDRRTDEYGVPAFGRGYGEEVMAWIDARYARVRLIGRDPRIPPARDPGPFGAAVLLPR